MNFELHLWYWISVNGPSPNAIVRHAGNLLSLRGHEAVDRQARVRVVRRLKVRHAAGRDAQSTPHYKNKHSLL